MHHVDSVLGAQPLWTHSGELQLPIATLSCRNCNPMKRACLPTALQSTLMSFSCMWPQTASKSLLPFYHWQQPDWGLKQVGVEEAGLPPQCQHRPAAGGAAPRTPRPPRGSGAHPPAGGGCAPPWTPPAFAMVRCPIQAGCMPHQSKVEAMSGQCAHE